MRSVFLFAAFFLLTLCPFSAAQNALNLQNMDSSKKVLILGAGVTGTWAAAKIAAHLGEKDELWIVTPPAQETVKDLGYGVFSNYTTSAFIPIGIQIEIGSINLEPPTLADVEKARTLKQFDVNSNLYVSPDLDSETERKLQCYISSDKHLDTSIIITRYHRDVCYREWQKYVDEGGKGIDFVGPAALSTNLQALYNFREKILKNRINSGYAPEENELKVLDCNALCKLLPRYSQMVKTKKLNGLIGFNYDGRVKTTDVMKTLHTQIENGAAKVVRIHEWIEGLQTKKNDLGNTIVTGVKLQSGRLLNADVVVSALGHGAEEVLKSAHIYLPILKKWGVVYSLSQDQKLDADEPLTILMRGVGIVRDLPESPIHCALGEWILPEGSEPNAEHVRKFVEESAQLWENIPFSEKRTICHPICVQPRPMTLDGLPVLDSRTQGLIILNPSGSQGNTQAPGSALFAISKVLEQLGRKVPADLQLPDTVDWQQFELYPGRFN